MQKLEIRIANMVSPWARGGSFTGRQRRGGKGSRRRDGLRVSERASERARVRSERYEQTTTSAA